MAKNLPVSAGDRFDPWVGKIPCRRAWQPTPVFLPGQSHGQRSLEGPSPRGHKESDPTGATEPACMQPVQHNLRLFRSDLETVPIIKENAGNANQRMLGARDSGAQTKGLHLLSPHSKER